MADPAFASARHVDQLTDVALPGLPADHMTEDDLWAPGDPARRIVAPYPRPRLRLTEEQADYVSRWIELYAIRPVGIPADGAPIESWEARIVNTLRTWGTRRAEQKAAGR